MDTRYSLTDYHEAVVQWMQTHLKWLNAVDAYPEIATELVTPAAYFSVIDWNVNDHQPMDGSLSVDLNCKITVAVPLKEPDYQVMIRNAAMALSIAVNHNHFDLDIEPATFVNSEPETFSPEMDDYAFWAVKYTQPMVLGEPTCFIDPEIIAKTVYSGIAPEIGIDHEDEYVQLYPLDK